MTHDGFRHGVAAAVVMIIMALWLPVLLDLPRVSKPPAASQYPSCAEFWISTPGPDVPGCVGTDEPNPFYRCTLDDDQRPNCRNWAVTPPPGYACSVHRSYWQVFGTPTLAPGQSVHFTPESMTGQAEAERNATATFIPSSVCEEP